jgi:hypothetical protein
MAFHVRRLPGEPIIIVEAVPPFDRHEVDDTNDRVHALARAIDSRVFRISDVRLINVTFESIQETLAEHRDAEPGSITDPQMIPVFVGGGELSHILADGFAHHNFGGVEVLLFSDLDPALAYIRDRVADGEF